jgi:uncharacterized protein (DUF488 family)
MMPTLWTIGHSNRSIDEFLKLLENQEIQAIADVRRFPGSRRHPHFGADLLREELSKAGIEYHHFAGLGGRRGKPAPDSPNTGWRVASFNAYADYMSGAPFLTDLDALISLARECRVCLMCSEALPWRCHRRLIADALIVRGWRVLDIMGSGQPREHALTSFVRVVGDRLIYPAVSEIE